MKPDKHLVAATGIAIAAACLTGLTWFGTLRTIDFETTEALNRASSRLTSQAGSFSEQINRQILALDQMLRFVGTAWQNNPAAFDLRTWLGQATVLDGISRDLVLTDGKGIIRHASLTEAINQDASGLDYFRALTDPDEPNKGLYIGPAAIDGIMRQWHVSVARRLHHADGSFAGVIDTDYRLAAINGVLGQADLGPGAMITLVGLDDGRLRGSAGAGTLDPDAHIADTAMFAAVEGAEQGLWTGPSANDAVPRIHAFRRVPNLRLVVIVAQSMEDALQPANVWRERGTMVAGGLTGLLISLALALIHATLRARGREAGIAAERILFAESSRQLEIARTVATAKADQLEATLSGMSDGISMIDADMRLVEWNSRFPEIAGVPPDILHVGLPMADILRAQASTGQFGSLQDPEAEVQRRMARLRTAPFGVVQRPRPDGRIVELRRNRLPDGGFVTLYADITERQKAEEALRAAQAAAEAANAEKSRFVAIVSHEIRTPLNALLNTVRLLSDSELAPAQQSLLAMARQSGDALFALLNDILDISQMEAGKLSIRPSLFELRPMLDSCIALFSAQAAQRGIRMHVAIADGTPAMLLTDPGRLRQVQLNLLSNAVKYARAGDVWLTAEPGLSDQEAVRLTVKDEGPPIVADARSRLFRPFLRLDRPEGDDAAGTGLGLSICQHLMTLMGGCIGCDVWRAPASNPSLIGHEGNAFWVTLPMAALPAAGDEAPATVSGDASAASAATMLDRPLPRTRILLTEDIAANQVIAATLLRRDGHHVDIASTGAEAIRAVESNAYDLIFMDIFMPGMSGQEATQIIRRLPGPASRLPIIALTANVAPEDAAVFKATGMDGLVGKPLSLDEMRAVINKHVWQQRQERRAEATACPDVGREMTIYDEVVSGSTIESIPVNDDAFGQEQISRVLSLERVEELRSNLPPGLFASLVKECLMDMDHRFQALRQALDAGEPQAVNEQAHALAGIAASYGMATLEVQVRAVMNAARNGNLSVLGRSVVKDIETEIRLTASCMQTMLRTELV